MSWFDGLRHRVRALIDPERHERDFSEEMRHHLELDAMQQGDASRARKRFGNRTYYQEETRRMTWLGSLDVLRQDFGYAWRSIRRTPGFTVMVVVTLALGLGANAATFTLIDRLFLRPPNAVEDPQDVRQIWFEHSAYRMSSGKAWFSSGTDYATYRTIAEASGDPRSFALFDTDFALYLRAGSERQRVRGVFASASYFHVLGVGAILGRLYTTNEDSLGAGAQVVVIGHRFWKSAFGGDSTIVGRRVRIEADEYAIIGVLEPGFEGLDLQAADVWIPLASIPKSNWIVQMGQGRPWWEGRRANGFTMLRRPSPGAPPDLAFEERATAAVRAEHRALQQRDSRAMLGGGLATPGADTIISKRLGGTAAIVLLIACANVINLLLARAVSRRREIAVRLALGISRARLIRLLTTETALLALIAGAVALFVAWGGGTLLRALLTPEVVWYESVLHWRVVLFAFGTAALAGIVSGVIPAIQASSPELTGALKEGTRDGTVHKSRLRQGLVIAQAALSVVLLVGAALFVRSLQNVRGLDLGYDTKQVLFGAYEFEAWQRPPRPVTAAALDEVAQRLAGRPGVESVALTAILPMRGLADVMFYFGSDSSASIRPNGPTFLLVSSSFFRTVGMRVLSGQLFQDGATAPRELVVNEAMAKRVWPDQSPIGQCLRFNRRDNPCYTVVGVVENARRSSLLEDEKPLYYLPLGNPPSPGWVAASVILRAEPDAVAGAAAELTTALRRAMPAAPVWVRVMNDVLEPEYRPWKLGATLFTGFGFLALIVAMVGIYSTVSYGVTQRTHEFGVRVALGARIGDVLRLVIGEGVRVVAVGVVVGVALALAAGKLVASLLYGVEPHDPLTMLLVGVVLLSVAAVAALLPAWRASRVDPVTALRAD
jgi:putative ABC transport system permease protein